MSAGEGKLPDRIGATVGSWIVEFFVEGVGLCVLGLVAFLFRFGIGAGDRLEKQVLFGLIALYLLGLTVAYRWARPRLGPGGADAKKGSGRGDDGLMEIIPEAPHAAADRGRPERR
jgi:hypothetical protein